MKKARRALLGAGFALYGGIMAYLLFWARGARTGTPFWEYARATTNLVPFRTIRAYVRALETGRISPIIPLYNLAGNFFLFIPLGFFLPAFFRRAEKTPGFILCAAALFLAVETLQLVTRRGSFDVDDIILNLAGALTGYVLYRMFRKGRSG